MADTRFIVDIFNEIVSEVRADYDTVNNLQPYYLHGHPLDISRVLSEKDDSDVYKFRKYPLIALLQDFREQHNTGFDWQMNIPTLRVLILDETDPNYDSAQRYENTFKPILYHLYFLLLEKMADNTKLATHSIEEIDHDKTDRLYWGREGIQGNQGLIFNDNLDGIDLTFNNLRVMSYSTCNFSPLFNPAYRHNMNNVFEDSNNYVFEDSDNYIFE